MVDVSLVPALELGAWSVPGTGARVDDGGWNGWARLRCTGQRRRWRGRAK